MSRYWCIDDAQGKSLAEGYAGDWPLHDGAVTKYAETRQAFTGVDDREYCRWSLAVSIYTYLRMMQPEGGEIPWGDVPPHIREMTNLSAPPAKVCVSF